MSLLLRSFGYFLRLQSVLPAIVDYKVDIRPLAEASEVHATFNAEVFQYMLAWAGMGHGNMENGHLIHGKSQYFDVADVSNVIRALSPEELLDIQACKAKCILEGRGRCRTYVLQQMLDDVVGFLSL